MAAEYRRRIREQWSNDPCGAIHSDGYVVGTREFFDRVEAHRYGLYAPWMPEVMGFDQFAGKDLLEVGCGMGTDLVQFARGGARVTGVDYTPRSVEISRQRFEVYGLEGRFLVGDAEALPFCDDSFDVVYSNGVLHHTPNVQAAIDEIFRVLRPGGLVRVMLYHRRSLYYWFVILLRHGIVQGELARSTAEEIMSRHVEYSETGAQPLVRAYTRAEVDGMFERFVDRHLQVRQLTREELRLPRFAPDSLVEALGRRWGWNVIITARKPG
jgi:ubiquinone/menaquinone biosynthesis C-methylase UbiE